MRNLKTLFYCVVFFSLIVCSKLTKAQTVVDEQTFKICTDKKLTALLYPTDKKFSLNLNDVTIVDKKSLLENDIESTIKAALQSKIDLAGCNDPVATATYQELLIKYPAYIALKLKKSPNSTTRSVKLNKDYSVYEILNPDYSYSYCLISADVNELNNILIFTCSNKQCTFKSDALKKQPVTDNIATIINFIQLNKEISFPDIYLLKSGDSEKLLFNSVITDGQIQSSDEVNIKKKQADSLANEAVTIKVKNAVDGKVFILKSSDKTNDTKKTEKTTDLSKRISFVIGLGPAIFHPTLYQLPVVDKSNNSNVIIEKAQHIKISASFGIIYTPYFYKITDPEHPNGEFITKGISYAAFLNPISILKPDDNQSIFNPIDFGVGVGYKTAGGISIMGTFELFGTRQPKDWFIEKYKSNNLNYSIPGANNTSDTQQTFDPSDNNIFRTRVIPSFGFKVCYTFDIIKSYSTASDGFNKPTP